MKANIFSVLIAILVVGGAIFLVSKLGNRAISFPAGDGNNVNIVNGKQIIELDAKGGYTPRISLAKAGMPTVLRFQTRGTFDCSAFIRIPSMSISKILPNSGTTDVDLGIPQSGILQGMCGMGMYPFEIDFEN